ncbi:MAG: hypothetical protein RLZZ574_351, partial [Cyanobacteriota bacterium]
GNFGLFEFVLEAGSKGASPHIHKQLTEMFYFDQNYSSRSKA